MDTRTVSKYYTDFFMISSGSIYNIPIGIWILDTHPYHPPMVFVKPTNTMQIKPGRNVDSNGKVDLPYLRDWRYVSLWNWKKNVPNYHLSCGLISWLYDNDLLNFVTFLQCVHSCIILSTAINWGIPFLFIASVRSPRADPDPGHRVWGGTTSLLQVLPDDPVSTALPRGRPHPLPRTNPLPSAR